MLTKKSIQPINGFNYTYRIGRAFGKNYKILT